MSVFAVRASLVQTLDDALAYFSYDVQVELATTERTSVLTEEALQVPGVEAAEPWRFASTAGRRATPAEGQAVIPFGLPPDAKSVRRRCRRDAGWCRRTAMRSWPRPTSATNDPDLAVGDTVTLRIDGKDTAWTLVGIAQSPIPAALPLCAGARPGAGDG